MLKSPGDVEITTDKMSYSPGETIKGEVKLKMKRNVSARCVRLKLFATQKEPYTDPKGRRTTRTQTIYDFAKELDKEHEYTGEYSYNFELKIPALQNQKTEMPDGTAGHLLQAGLAIASRMGKIKSPPEWFINVSLDVPKAKDAGKTIELNIG
ncbi:MAG: hypothetical protein ABH950_07795 [Candidatus Altiarchaeota archaeon]